MVPAGADDAGVTTVPPPSPGPTFVLADEVVSPLTGQLWQVFKSDEASYATNGTLQVPSLDAAWAAEAHALSPAARVLLKLAPSLRAQAVDGGDAPLRVFATLRDQPVPDLAADVWARFEPRLAPLRARLLAAPADRDAADAHEAIASEARRVLLSEARATMADAQDAVVGDALARGWQVLDRGWLVNDLLLVVSSSDLLLLAADERVAHVDPDPLLRPRLDVANKDQRTYDVWQDGQTGASGAFDPAIIDTGVDGAHPAFAGKTVTAKVFHDTAQGDGCYDDNAASTDDIHGHGTSTSSIAASGDAGFPGSAKGAPTVLHGKAGFNLVLGCPFAPLGGGAMYDSDGRKAVNWSVATAADPAEGINLSFGGDDGCEAGDGDSGQERFFDALAYSLDIPTTISAGNDGNGSCTTTDPCDAYNVLCVGAVDDKDSASRGDNAIAGFSSRGPTGDGRLKPDLTASGVDLRSANAFWENEADWVDFSGTSMAAPLTLGAVTLLQNGGVTRAMDLKALLMATGERSAPYAKGNAYGYGYVDAKKAWDHRGHILHTNAPAVGTDVLYKLGSADAAALVWQRHATWAGSDVPGVVPLPMSDLDLFVYDEADNAPVLSDTKVKDYAGDSFTASRPVARLRTVSLASGLSSEPFALATTGAITGPFTLPSLSLAASAPSGANTGTAFTVWANATDTGQLRANGVRFNLTLAAGCSTPSANPATLSGIEPGATGGVSWSVTCTTPGTAAFTARVDTTAKQYGLGLPSAQVALSVSIVSGNAAPTVNLTTPANGARLGSSTVTVTATATDDAGVASVSVQADGGSFQGMTCTGPATAPSCTRDVTLADGAHTLRVKACDGPGLCVQSGLVSVTVDTLPPAIALTGPADGAWLAAPFTVSATATDAGTGVSTADVQVDGGAFEGMTCTGPASNLNCTRSMTGLADGDHQLRARACDSAGLCGFSGTLTVHVDSTPPTVGVARPAAGSLILGDVETAQLPLSQATVVATQSLTVRATASDTGPAGAAVVKVTFSLGARSCVATAAPWQCSIPTAGYFYSGSLAARAEDRAGNVATATRAIVVAGG